MSLNKDSILHATNRGLNVFKHFMGSRFNKIGKSFKSPFYQDNQASCYVYLDKKSNIYKFKDFGDAEYSGDCFFFVGKKSLGRYKNSGGFQSIIPLIS